MDVRSAWALAADGPTTGPIAKAAYVLRLVTSSVFLPFGAAKFIQHTAEVRSFHGYGLPSPGVVVYAVGVLEVIGGAMLLTGLLVRLAALALVGDMTGAIVLSGINHGELISLTLAPAMLVCLVVLSGTGAGVLGLDHRRVEARDGVRHR